MSHPYGSRFNEPFYHFLTTFNFHQHGKRNLNDDDDRNLSKEDKNTVNTGCRKSQYVAEHL